MLIEVYACKELLYFTSHEMAGKVHISLNIYICHTHINVYTYIYTHLDVDLKHLYMCVRCMNFVVEFLQVAASILVAWLKKLFQ